MNEERERHAVEGENLFLICLLLNDAPLSGFNVRLTEDFLPAAVRLLQLIIDARRRMNVQMFVQKR